MDSQRNRNLRISSTLLLLMTMPGAVLQAQAQAVTPAPSQQTQQPDTPLPSVSILTTTTALRTQMSSTPVKKLADLTKVNELGRQVVDLQCEADASSDQCAAAAAWQVTELCNRSAELFKKDSTTWKWVGFSLLIASAAFTGVGASATLANAKVFSTLGATTGLGSVVTLTTSNQGAAQGGLLVLNQTSQAFLKFIQSGGKDGAPADNDLIYRSAPAYALECITAAAVAQKS